MLDSHRWPGSRPELSGVLLHQVGPDGPIASIAVIPGDTVTVPADAELSVDLEIVNWPELVRVVERGQGHETVLVERRLADDRTGGVLQLALPTRTGQLRGAAMTTVGLTSEGDNLGYLVIVLGGFRLLWGTSMVRVPRASQRLLAFLALRGGSVERATVAGTLWPDATELRAYSSLRASLARLQRTARKALTSSRLEVGLAEGVEVDIHRSRTLARRVLDSAAVPGPSELGMAAVADLSADLLPGWYDDWVLIEADDWRQLRLSALEALAGHLSAAGRLGEAANAARAAVRAEPLRESARAILIQVYLAEGNQSEAVGEFQRYRTLLHTELGLEPTPRLCGLIEGLRIP